MQLSVDTLRSTPSSLPGRVALTITYDGPWGLENAPGGGPWSARIVWHPYGGAPYRVSDDLVLRTVRQPT